MPTYVINQFDIFDSEKYKDYQKIGGPSIKKHGGRVLVAGGKLEYFAGDPTFASNHTPRVIVLEFDTFEKAKAWYQSPEYQEAAKIRDLCARARIFIVDGVTPPT